MKLRRSIEGRIYDMRIEVSEQHEERLCGEDGYR